MIASDVLLLLLEDRTGRPESVAADTAVTGGVLADLALAGRIRLTDDEDPGGKDRVQVVDETSLGDPVLDAALAALVEATRDKDGTPPGMVRAMRAIGRDVMEQVAERLVDAGALARDEPGFLGGIRRPRYVEADGGAERALRDRLVAVLTGEREADPADAAVIGLVYASEAVGAVFGPELPDIPARDLLARAERYAKGAWGADAITQQVALLTYSVVGTIMSTSVVLGTAT